MTKRSLLLPIVSLSLLFFPSSLIAQIKITGIVVDQSTNSPLSGVSIVIIAGDKSTQSNQRGEFEIELQPGQELTFRRKP